MATHKEHSRRQEVAQVNNPLQRQLDGRSYCVQTITQGPRAASPLHFSYKQDSTDGTSKDYEADLNGDHFDVTIHSRHPATDLDRQSSKVPGAKALSIRDGFAESLETSHYKRSDRQGWSSAANGMVLGASPWQLFVARPDVTEAGSETIMGYPTIKYAVDTRHQSAPEKAPTASGWGVTDYSIAGSAWATKDTACILQYAIDLEKTTEDGKVEKTHYSGSITKP